MSLNVFYKSHVQLSQNRRVFSCRPNANSVGEASHNAAGRSFQTRGPATTKDLSRNVVLARGVYIDGWSWVEVVDDTLVFVGADFQYFPGRILQLFSPAF